MMGNTNKTLWPTQNSVFTRTACTGRKSCDCNTEEATLDICTWAVSMTQGWQRGWELLLGWGVGVWGGALTRRRCRAGVGGAVVVDPLRVTLSRFSPFWQSAHRRSWWVPRSLDSVQTQQGCNSSYSSERSIRRQNTPVWCADVVRYLLLQGLLHRLIPHLLLPQTGRQRHVLCARLCAHLSDLLIGPVRDRKWVRPRDVEAFVKTFRLDRKTRFPGGVHVLVQLLLSMDFKRLVSLLLLLDSGQILLSALLQHLFVLYEQTQCP